MASDISIQLGVGSTQSDPKLAADGIRALQDFISRPELGIKPSMLEGPSGPGQKGLNLGFLSVLFDKNVLNQLAEMLRAFLMRNKNLTLKFPTKDGEVQVTSENISTDQIIQLLNAVGQFQAAFK